MSNYMADLGGVLGTRKVGDTTVNITKKGSNMDLDMMDFITLMITQMTNQGIDDSMDTSEMLNQMVQMQMIQSMVNMTDATLMNYSASLVGKEVTVGKWNGDKLEEIVGVVTGTGTKDGLPVIFVNDEYYYLSEIMAVGHLPKAEEPEEDDKVGDPGETEGADKTEDEEKTEGADKPKDPDATEGTDKAEGSDGTETVQPGGETETPENGTPENGEG